MRVDRLKGKRLTVGTHALSIKKKIGEGGSAFVYVAKRSGGAPFSFSSADQDQQQHQQHQQQKENVVPSPSLPPLVTSSSSLSSSSPAQKILSSLSGRDRAAAASNNAITRLRPFSWKFGGSSNGTIDGSFHSASNETPTTPTSKTKEQQQQQRKLSSKKRQRLVVLKASAVGGSNEHRRRAIGEAEILRLLSSHPNVVTILESCFFRSSSNSSSPSPSASTPLFLRKSSNGNAAADFASVADDDDGVELVFQNNRTGRIEATKKNNDGSNGYNGAGGNESEMHLLLMEHCSGGSLMDLISKRRKLAIVRNNKKNKKQKKKKKSTAAFPVSSSSSSADGEKGKTSSSLRRKIYLLRNLGLMDNNQQGSNDHVDTKKSFTNAPTTINQPRRYVGRKWMRGGGGGNGGGTWDAAIFGGGRSSVTHGTETAGGAAALGDIEVQKSSLAAGYLDRNDVLDIFRQVVDAVSYMHKRGDLGFSSLSSPSSSSSPKSVTKTTACSPAQKEGSDDNEQATVTAGEEEQECHLCRHHTHTPSIVHRDLKPENILLDFNYGNDLITASSPTRGSSNGDCTIDRCYSNDDNNNNNHYCKWNVKLCDFGSAIIGDVSVSTPEEREDANRVIRSSTSQMYRSPEMIDLHMVEELTNKTDIWALGCTLYTTCFLQNCFDEDSSLASLSGRYLIPPGHSFGSDMEELIRRMLIIDPADRADINEVSACVNAMREGKDLPPRPPSKCCCQDKEKVQEDSSTDERKVEEDLNVAKCNTASLSTGAADELIYSENIDKNVLTGARPNMTSQNYESVAARRRKKVIVETSNIVSKVNDHPRCDSQFWCDTASLPPLGYGDSQSINDDDNTCYTGASSIYSDRWADQSTFSMSSTWASDSGLQPMVGVDLTENEVDSSDKTEEPKWNSRMLQRSQSLPEEHATHHQSISTSGLFRTEQISISKDWVSFDGSETFVEVSRAPVVDKNQVGENELPCLAESPVSSNDGSVTGATPSTSGDNSPVPHSEKARASNLRLSLSWDRFASMRDNMPLMSEKDTYNLLDDTTDSENPDRTRRLFPTLF